MGKVYKNLYLTDFDKKFNNYSKKDFFLGAWCFGDIDELSNKNFIKYHWSKIERKKRDYIFLEKFRNELIDILSKELNNYYDTKKNKRYWNILLEPWLTTYVSIMFDRWQSINDALKINKFSVNFYNSIMKKNHYFFFELSKSLSSDPIYNQKIFQRILLEDYFKNKVNLKFINDKINFLFKRDNYTDNFPFYRRVINQLLQLFDRILLKNKNNNFIYFPFSSMTMISKLRLKLLSNHKILFFFNEIEEIEKKINTRIQKEIKLSKLRTKKIKNKTNNKFKRFIYKHILSDLPTAVLEDYKFIYELVSDIKINPKKIIASSNYWHKYSFKIWIAKKVLDGSTFNILDHGRGLPLQKELLNFESYFLDKKLSWHKPLSNKYIQVPALHYSKYKFSQSIGKYCAVIGYEGHKYGNIINFHAQSSNSLKSYFQIVNFYNNLEGEIKKSFLIKTKKYKDFNYSWDLDSFYEKKIGKNKIYKKGNYINFINNSKILICTYPLTTLSDSILSSKPTILIIPTDCYFFHSKFDKFIGELIHNKIIFYDAAKAAKHINDIWSDPNLWWNSKIIVDLRHKYKQNFCNFDKNSIEKWCKILKI